MLSAGASLDTTIRGEARSVTCGGIDWHIQLHGPTTGSTILLLHGTGASAHSWRHVAPILARRHRLLIPDLPGHGQTRTRSTADLSLNGMVTALRTLTGTLGFAPDVIIGHSAGAAIAITLAARLSPAPRLTIGINGAFLPIRGARVFSPMAKLLFANPLSAPVFALLNRATPLSDSLLHSTGSAIDAEGQDVYRRLLRTPAHLKGALGMMAAWDLNPFASQLRAFAAPLVLIAARDDPMVPCSNSHYAAALAPQARLVLAAKGGHLLHEIAPDPVCAWIDEAMAKTITDKAGAA